MDLNFTPYLYKERAKNSSSHASIRFVSHFVQACLTTFLLWGIVPNHFLMIWLFVITVTAICIFILQKQLSPDKPLYTPERWKLMTVGCSFIIAFVWSLAPAIFFVPGNTYFIICILALFSGYVSGSLAVNTTYKFSFIGFLIGITLPFMARLLYEGDELYYTIVGLIVFYITMLTYVSHNLHKQFIKAVEIQYENEMLIEELDKEKTVAQSAVTAKDKFLASASHDLRQPLNALGLFSEALTPLQTTEKGRDILFKVKQCLNGLNGMLHGLLDISRLDAEVVDNNPKHVCLKTVIDQLDEEYRQNKKKIEIKTSILNSDFVFIDPTILYRILNNLLDNAVKYTHVGEICISSDALDNEFIGLTISDTGIGIPENKIDAIFDEFIQLNNPERDREKGLGLGLSIVKRLCYIADVEINISSKVNIGSKIVLKFQRGKRYVDSYSDQSEVNVNLNDKYILVIDDEKNILEGMQYLLSSYGCDVVIAESLTQILGKLKQRQNIPDLIISDLRLRNNETGSDVIDAIRDEFNTDIPALLITGDTAPERIVKADAQEYETLYKPIDPRELKQKIERLFSLN